jgi:hypothetical protein
MRVPLLNGQRHGRLTSHFHQTFLSLEQDREFHTCLCVHVRTGTLLLGMFQLVAHAIILLTTIALVMRPNVLNDARQQYKFVDTALSVFPFPSPATTTERNDAGKINEFKPISSDKIENIPAVDLSEDAIANNDKLPASPDGFPGWFGISDPRRLERHQKTEVTKRGERLWTLTLTSLFLFFTCLLIHGVLFRKPSHLLPYFSVQVFDFVLSCLTVMGYMTYMPYARNHNMEDTVSNKNHQAIFSSSQNLEKSPSPLRYQNWEHINPTTRLAIMTFAFLMLALKAYFMSMVWACYKYLIMWHRINMNGGNADVPTTLREAWRDMWSQMRRPVFFAWMSTTARASRESTTNDLESQSLLRPAEGDVEASDLPSQPPTYDELLKQPANANMPPPYFKEGATSALGNSSKGNH